MNAAAKPSPLCLTCRDCNGRGYSSPDPCERCSGRGWLAFGATCGAKHQTSHNGATWVHRCGLEPWHEGDHIEALTFNEGTFYFPRYRKHEHRWPSAENEERPER